MRYEQISAAIARIAAVVTAVRGFIGTEAVVRAFDLHLSRVRMSMGLLCCSSSTSYLRHPSHDARGRGLKRNDKPAANQLGISPWQLQLLPTPCPAAGLGLANC